MIVAIVFRERKGQRVSSKYAYLYDEQVEYKLIQRLAQQIRQSQSRELTLEEIHLAMDALREVPAKNRWVN